jgi:hypothetical protein
MVTLVAAVSLAAPLASAQPAAHWPASSPASQLERSLNGLNCDAVVMINNASRQRQSPQGHALADMLEASHAFPETTAAWRELAAALDWPTDTAFDELLGRRVTIIARGLDSPGEPAWALLTEVSLQTERRLRDKLKAAPRGTINGLGVLSVEDGKYELVVGRATPNVDPNLVSVTGAPPPTAAVLLCPGDDCPLMAELAPSLLNRTGLAAPSPLWRAGERQREPDVLVMMRPHAATAGSTEPRSDRFLAITATLEPGGWDAKLSCSCDLLWGRPAALSDIRPWSDAAFNAVEHDSLAACMGVIGSVRWSPHFARLAALQAVLPALEAGPCGQLAALVVQPASRARPAAEHRIVHGEPDPILASISRSTRAPDSAPAAADPAPLSVTLAVESRPGCRAVSQGDEAVARLVTALRTGEVEDAGDRPAVRLEVGVAETETRVLGLTDFPMQGRLADSIRRCFGAEPTISWGGLRASIQANRTGRSVVGPSDWWFASISPESSAAPSRVAAALMGPEAGTPQRRLSIGTVRPAALADYLDAADEDRAWLRSLDSLHWDAWLTADGAVEGRLSVRMTSGR